MQIRGIPVGFAFQLAKEPDALRNFSVLPAEEKSHVIERARAVSDKAAMRRIVTELACGKLTG